MGVVLYLSAMLSQEIRRMALLGHLPRRQRARWFPPEHRSRAGRLAQRLRRQLRRAAGRDTPRRGIAIGWDFAATIASLLLVPSIGYSDLDAETVAVETLPAEPGSHWVWVNDIALTHMADGKAHLVDGDTGALLGMLSTGYGFVALAIPSDYEEIYAPETYFSRGSRGKRTDVVTIYDPSELRPIGEVIIPPKRLASTPTLANAALTDDGRFLLLYNFTPASSVTVVDVEKREFSGEIETPGCALIYPSGSRRFNMLCGDGGLLTISLNDRGEAMAKRRSEPFFDPEVDPVTEKAVRIGQEWLFLSFEGFVHPVDVSGEAPAFGSPWSLLEPSDRLESWRIGGLQHLAVHRANGRLYSVVHQGGDDTHKDPGTEIWVYDLETRERVKRIQTRNPVGSIQVSQDDAPLLFTAFSERPSLDVYDARTGLHLRTVEELGLTPTILQTP